MELSIPVPVPELPNVIPAHPWFHVCYITIAHSNNLAQTFVSPIIIGEKARPLRAPHSSELGPANDHSVSLAAVDLDNLDIWKTNRVVCGLKSLPKIRKNDRR